MVGRRALVLLLVTSLLAAGIPKRARAAEPSNAAVGVAGAFVNSLLRDAEVQELLRSVISELPPSIEEQFEQIAQLAVSGATPDDITQSFTLIVSSLPEETESNIKQLISRLSYVAGSQSMRSIDERKTSQPAEVHADVLRLRPTNSSRDFTVLRRVRDDCLQHCILVGSCNWTR